MKIRVRDSGSISVVEVVGSVSQEFVPIFKLKLQELYEEGRTNIVLDMSEAQYISSMGLAVIINLKNRLAQRSGDLRMVNPSEPVKNLFEITNLLRRFEVFDNSREAVRSFQEAGEE